MLHYLIKAWNKKIKEIIIIVVYVAKCIIPCYIVEHFDALILAHTIGYS